MSLYGRRASKCAQTACFTWELVPPLLALLCFFFAEGESRTCWRRWSGGTEHSLP